MAKIKRRNIRSSHAVTIAIIVCGMGHLRWPRRQYQEWENQCNYDNISGAHGYLSLDESFYAAIHQNSMLITTLYRTHYTRH